jgi:hypothetical protein
MAKTVHNDVLDAALNYLKTNCTQISCCEAQPTTYASAAQNGGKCLAISDISGADFTGPAEGDSSGRKITVGQKANVEVSTTGSAHIFVLLNSSASQVEYTTDVSGPQQITDGNTMTFNSWDIEIADPT